MNKSVRFLTIFVTLFAILTAGNFSLADDNYSGDTTKEDTNNVMSERMSRFRNGRVIEKGESPIGPISDRPIRPLPGNPPIKDNPRFPPGKTGEDKPPAQGSSNKAGSSIIEIEITDSVKDELAAALSSVYLEIRSEEEANKNIGLTSRTLQRIPVTGKLSRESAEFKKRVRNLIDTQILKDGSPLFNRDLDYDAHLESLANQFSEKYLVMVSTDNKTLETEVALSLLQITLESYTAAILKHIKDTQPNLFLRVISSRKFIITAFVLGAILSADGVGMLNEGYAFALSAGAGYGTRKYLQTRTKPLAVKTGLLSRSTHALRTIGGKAISLLKKDEISNLLILVDSFWLKVADGIETLAESEDDLERLNITITSSDVLARSQNLINSIDAGQGIRNEMVQFKTLLLEIEKATSLTCKDLLVAHQ